MFALEVVQLGDVDNHIKFSVLSFHMRRWMVAKNFAKTVLVLQSFLRHDDVLELQSIIS